MMYKSTRPLRNARGLFIRNSSRQKPSPGVRQASTTSHTLARSQFSLGNSTAPNITMQMLHQPESRYETMTSLTSVESKPGQQEHMYRDLHKRKHHSRRRQVKHKGAYSHEYLACNNEQENYMNLQAQPAAAGPANVYAGVTNPTQDVLYQPLSASETTYYSKAVR